MGGIFVFIVVGVIIAVAVRKSQKLQKEQGEGHGAENFPFPPMQREVARPFDPWDFGDREREEPVMDEVVADEVVAAEGAAAPVVYSSIVVPESVSGEIGNSAALSEGWEHRARNPLVEEFDLRQAVIYSAILETKF